MQDGAAPPFEAAVCKTRAELSVGLMSEAEDSHMYDISDSREHGGELSCEEQWWRCSDETISGPVLQREETEGKRRRPESGLITHKQQITLRIQGGKFMISLNFKTEALSNGCQMRSFFPTNGRTGGDLGRGARLACVMTSMRPVGLLLQQIDSLALSSGVALPASSVSSLWISVTPLAVPHNELGTRPIQTTS
ncbi:hypothetical protein EYF80_022000 [Liparis tanakae]|uniref:Uncharacterized protein n=1 Tax=Liparis tanakae TaxID=230148 RepID=A0A4Z2HPS6_9TELE|nr:hypothetical protein EYF80_022000 [Liparis tanakae]